MSRRLRSYAAPRSLPRIGALVTWALAVAGGVTAVAAQEPPDSVQVADSAQVADSLAADEAQAVPDSLDADTIFHNLPEVRPKTPAGFETGIWTWDRDAIMASGANTLAELFAEVPGLIALWGGDYGTPAMVSAFGLGGGGYRVVRDGFEMYPLDGGVVDLQRVPLVGISEVRLDRSAGAMEIEMWSHRHDDGRSFSVVEAGTGDLDTNTFRGVFADPTALGGSVAVGLERADTRGIGATEGGNRTGTWVRYQLHLRDRAGLAFDLRSTGSQTKVPTYASTLGRSELSLRASFRVVDGVVAEAYTGRSTLDAEDAGSEYVTWGGERTQHGLGLGVDAGPAWARASFRLFGDDDLPQRDLDVRGGLVREGVGGATGRVRSGRWGGRSTTSWGARAWVGPVSGLSAFGAYEAGTFGSRDGPVLDGFTDPPIPGIPQPADPLPGPAITDRTTLRVGGSASLFGVSLAGAVLRVDSDVDLPLGTEVDYGAAPEPGRSRTGYEAYGSVPVPIMRDLHLVGSYQRWEDAGPFLPDQIYRAYLQYHRVQNATGTLELWWSVGVRGHDPMAVFVPDDGLGGPGGLETVPFYQNWFGRIQVRVVTVRLFFGWDNMTLRRRLQTFPERRLPYQRTFFALRWDMWN